ncbi:hypothetical protein P280DRAFT_476193 [Massarina eburnea CBS 473.64]|uniref:Uncharacterized protein n=1 Tax=Massarina eburnea CBS 473.64 TaxID=1395130 RepID=A0A6A6SG84_9PLEO|nr:hypothetical protein P280DRAFT_476193 [Massarina eburnea CBS 473.64]
MASDRVSSYGRGGAGNITKEHGSPQPTAADLVTPVLKSEHYTTGRGGTGNMARNNPNFPEIARASQDVEAPLHREPEGPHHYGRGGAANVAKPTEEEKRAAHEHSARSDETKREDGAAGKGLVDKVKEGLSKLGKK